MAKRKVAANLDLSKLKKLYTVDIYIGKDGSDWKYYAVSTTDPVFDIVEKDVETVIDSIRKKLRHWEETIRHKSERYEYQKLDLK